MAIRRFYEEYEDVLPLYVSPAYGLVKRVNGKTTTEITDNVSHLFAIRTSSGQAGADLFKEWKSVPLIEMKDYGDVIERASGIGAEAMLWVWDPLATQIVSTGEFMFSGLSYDA